MRKQDKKKNIKNVNLLAEQRYLKSKGLIKENEYGLDIDEQRPPMPRPSSEYKHNTMVGTVLYDYFFKGKHNANDAEFLDGYLKALQMQVQQTNTMINNLKNGISNINGVPAPRPKMPRPASSYDGPPPPPPQLPPQ